MQQYALKQVKNWAELKHKHGISFKVNALSSKHTANNLLVETERKKDNIH